MPVVAVRDDAAPRQQQQEEGGLLMRNIPWRSLLLLGLILIVSSNGALFQEKLGLQPTSPGTSSVLPFLS